MAKKQLKKIEAKIRPIKLGLTRARHKFSNCSFRLGIIDRQHLGVIAHEMNNLSRQKKITMTDALRAMIQYCLDVDKSILIKSLSETL